MAGTAMTAIKTVNLVSLFTNVTSWRRLNSFFPFYFIYGKIILNGEMDLKVTLKSNV